MQPLFTVHWKASFAALLLTLVGCAHEPMANGANQPSSSAPSNEFKSGEIRLHCESACFFRWNAKSHHLKALHNNKLWADLANEVREIDHISDLSYYYLGRAAEGLGHLEAATTYYRLALSHLHRCEGWLSGCDGFDFPRDIRLRLAGLPTNKSKSPSPSTSNPDPVKTMAPPSAASAQPLRREPTRSGTGFFIHPEGLMVTSLHVVDKASSITVNTRGEVKRSAQLLAKNEPCDLAVLKIATKVQHWLPIQRDARKIKRGSEVLTIGYPRVNLQGLESKVTNGLISSLSGVENNPNFFQISVPIQPGNSGGPLVSREGMVVGVISSKLAINPSLDTTQLQPENVNYAVRSTCLRDLLRTLPAKYRTEAKKSKKNKTSAKGKTKSQSKDMSMVELTERVEKTVALVLVSVE